MKSLEFFSATEEELDSLCEFFSLFADSSRIKILCALARSPLCATDLEECSEISRTAIVHQLRRLKRARLVKTYKENRKTVYALDDDHIHRIFETGLEHIRHGKEIDE